MAYYLLSHSKTYPMKYIPITLLTLCLFAKPTFSQTKHRTTQIGDSLLSKYQFQKALAYFEHELNIEKKNVKTLSKIALCHRQLGNSNKEKATYEAILKIDSSHIPSLNQMGGIYLQLKNYEKSTYLFRYLSKQQPDNSYYYKQLGKVAHRASQFIDAVIYYEKAISLNKNDIESTLQLCKIYYNLQLYTKLDSCIALGKALDDLNTVPWLYEMKSSYAQKKYNNTIDAINRALELGEDSSVFIMQKLGVSFYHHGQYYSAIKVLKRLLEQDKNNESIHYYLGLSYKKIREFEKGQYHFESAIDKGITRYLSDYYVQLALCFEEQGLLEKSIKSYQIAYKSSKQNILLYHLARNYDLYYKDKSTALSYYERYLAMNDSDHIPLLGYSKKRISELKEIIHFDTGNTNNSLD